MQDTKQELIYIFSEKDADRLYKLTVALSNAMGEFLTTHQHVKGDFCIKELKEASYDFWEMGYYERLHELKNR